MQETAPAANILKHYQEVLQQLPQCEKRESQERMIALVTAGIRNNESQVIEAGTGSGKSFGYLIPALLDIESTRPVVISTATIALQEQLVNKDIPFLAKAMGLDNLSIRMVKGRGNYLCINKLMELDEHIKPTGSEALYVNYLKSELSEEWQGDRAELDLTIPPEIWQEIRSDAEDCLGNKCKFFKENPYRIAREDLDRADILVTNHALYLQDILSGKMLLPPHDLVIFDEAHQIKSQAINAFTIRIGKYATTKLLQKISRRIRPIPDQYIRLIQDAEAAMLDWLFKGRQETFRLYPDDLFLNLTARQISVLSELELWLAGTDVGTIKGAVENDLAHDKLSIQKTKLVAQLQGLITRWEYFMAQDMFQSMRVNWVELDFNKLYYELKSTPLNVSGVLNETLWAEKTAILTSATLAVNQNLDFFKNDLGIADADSAVLPSPFDYESNSFLYLPQNMPDPNSEGYLAACATEIEKILIKSKGRAFVLFTSNNSMRTVSDMLIPKIAYPSKVQGELPRQKLVDWFKATPNSVIFATATFWEGIDIPGDTLSCVIMDKIPFSPPNDPVTQASIDLFKAQGADWFSGLMLPQAVLKLKQGFGRLIRSKTDKGLVAILDPRMTQKGYGRIIQRSLPAVPLARDLDEIPEDLFT